MERRGEEMKIILSSLLGIFLVLFILFEYSSGREPMTNEEFISNSASICTDWNYDIIGAGTELQAKWGLNDTSTNQKDIDRDNMIAKLSSSLGITVEQSQTCGGSLYLYT